MTNAAYESDDGRWTLVSDPEQILELGNEGIELLWVDDAAQLEQEVRAIAEQRFPDPDPSVTLYDINVYRPNCVILLAHTSPIVKTGASRDEALEAARKYGRVQIRHGLFGNERIVDDQFLVDYQMLKYDPAKCKSIRKSKEQKARRRIRTSTVPFDVMVELVNLFTTRIENLLRKEVGLSGCRISAGSSTKEKMTIAMKLQRAACKLEGKEVKFPGAVSELMPFVKSLLASKSDTKIKFAKWLKKMNQKVKKK